MDPEVISVYVPGIGAFVAHSDVLDKAIAYFSLAEAIQLRAILVNMADDVEDYSQVKYRSTLLIMICHLSGNTLPGIRGRIPAMRQARKIVRDAAKLHNQLETAREGLR